MCSKYEKQAYRNSSHKIVQIITVSERENNILNRFPDFELSYENNS